MARAGFQFHCFFCPAGTKNHPWDIEPSFARIGNHLAGSKPICAPFAQLQDRQRIVEAAS
jgi:hypothetical protein